MTTEEAINILAEFNKWRRGLPPYAWNEDPSKQKELQYSAKEIGVAIDAAVDMLRQSADMMERERRYEYAAMFVLKRNGKCIAESASHYMSLEEARLNNHCPLAGEDIRFARREVGEWEEVE